MYSIDIDELPELNRNISCFGYNRNALAALYDADYGDSSKRSIRDKVAEVLQQHGIAQVSNRIELVTTPKILGMGFNPVSFYYCYDEQDVVFAYIAEITNTFEERAVYVFNALHEQQHFQVKKVFHVSPFYDNHGDYHVQFHPLTEKLDISFNLKREGEKPFIARMQGTAHKFEQHSSVLLRYGLTILLTLPRIYLQAIKLFFIKRLSVMKKPNPPHAPALLRAKPYSWFTQACMSQVKKILQRSIHGTLVVEYPDGTEERYGQNDTQEQARLRIDNFSLFNKVAKYGGIGFGESYVNGDWTTPDLTAVMRFVLDNASIMSERSFNWIRPLRFLGRINHWFQRNTRLKARKNISEHYDLGNDMFSLFLDPSMTYSSAIFEDSNESLLEAQHRKIRTILHKAQARKGDSILEIGCGWGELATIAAKEFGCTVKGITLSKEQEHACRDKIRRYGLEEAVSIELKDYRDVKGRYDKIVSVEMIEAVGKEYLDTFLQTIDALLAPDGIAVLQIIAYPDNDYKNYLKRQDWIQKHIFPGSHLPSLTAFCESMTKCADLIVEQIENYSEHYARTLEIWRNNFNSKHTELSALGYDERFQRAWNFYLSSCEAEFSTRWLSLYQIVLTRPNNKALAQQKVLLPRAPLKAA